MAFQSPFPESERIAFDRNPIVLAAVEEVYDLSFEVQGASLTAFRSAIAERFPRYTEMYAELQLPHHLGGQTGAGQKPTYCFSNETSKMSVKLSEASLRLELLDYVSYEQLRGEWQDLYKTFTATIMNKSRRRNVSLTYVDVFDLQALKLQDYSVTELFNGSLLGPITQFENSVSSCTLQTTYKLNEENDNLECQFQYERGGSSDAASRAVSIIATFRSGGAGPPDTLARLDDLKRHAGRFFRWSITDNLASQLGGRPIPDFEASKVG